MPRFLVALLCATLLGPAQAAGLLEREISFSEAEVQSALNKYEQREQNYGGLVRVMLIGPPQISLGSPEGQAGVAARLNISLLGGPAVPVDVTGIAGIRYDAQRKAFFLDNPRATSVQSQALSRDNEPMARQAINAYIVNYFRNRPVHVLRETGSPEEVAARWLLKAVRIEGGKVVATLSTL